MPKVKIQITHWITGSVLFEYESDGNTIYKTLKKALQSDANLRGANLRGANLRDADLRDANLRGANLRGANLRGVDLRGADLRDADLRDANLRGVDLRGADLRDADLRDADLRDANLRGVDLRGADLRGANLRDANLRGAKNAEYAQAQTVVVPEGSIIGWKMAWVDKYGEKSRKVIVQLRIPEDAKRSNASGRKCRAEYAEVLAVYEKGKKRKLSKKTIIQSDHDGDFSYQVGDILKPTQPFDTDRWTECAPGIHFFITRVEAENY